jgi:hypothetical protein
MGKVSTHLGGTQITLRDQQLIPLFFALGRAHHQGFPTPAKTAGATIYPPPEQELRGRGRWRRRSLTVGKFQVVDQHRRLS